MTQQTTHDTAREKIFAILSACAATMSCQHVPTRYVKDSEWPHIEWNITIKTPRGELTTKYCQGIGHLPKVVKSGCNARSLYATELIEQMLQTGKASGKPLSPPLIVDVVGSLVSDASAADYPTFEQWARDLGYDEDSRKGHAIYEQCRAIALDLLRLLGASGLEQLRKFSNDL